MFVSITIHQQEQNLNLKLWFQKLILLKRGRDVSWAVIKLIAVFTAKFPAVLSAPLHYRAHQQEKHMILALYRYHQRLHLLTEGHHWWIHSLHVTNDKTDKTSIIIMFGEDEDRKDLFSPGKHSFAWTCIYKVESRPNCLVAADNSQAQHTSIIRAGQSHLWV